MTRHFLCRFAFVAVACTAAVGCHEPSSRENIASRSGRLFDLSLERFPDSPLTALARFRTEAPARVTVTIVGQDGEHLIKGFDQYRTVHEVPLLGLYPDFSNTIVLRLDERNGATSTDTIKVVTPPLPVSIRNIPLRTVRVGDAPLAPGFTLLLLSREYGGSREESHFMAVDAGGRIRWVYTGQHLFMGKLLPNGHLVVQVPNALTRLRSSYNHVIEPLLAVAGWHSVLRYLYWGIPDTHTPGRIEQQRANPVRSLPALIASWLPSSLGEHNTLHEIDLFGRVIAQWKAEGFSIHHDFLFLPNGDLLVLASTPTDDEDLIVQLERHSGRTIRVIDLKQVLDVDRSVLPRHVSNLDWLHANALLYEERDSTIVVSARNQSAVAKLSLDPLRVRWILGDHDRWSEPFHPYLLQLLAGEFAWGQHAPMRSPVHPQRFLLFDNGNQRSYHTPMPPESSYSRAVEYEVDENARTATQTWSYGSDNRWYSPVVGNAEYLSNGNRLVCFGGIARDREGRAVEWIEPAETPGLFRNRSVKSCAVIVEVTGDNAPRPLWELRIEDPDRSHFVGYLVYRAHRISLY
jgi:arylsulfate sulfotransferase